jgi:phosphoenolpyruvate-protein kinase (PTS system EI component)
MSVFMTRVLKSIDVDPDLYEDFKKLAKTYKLTNKDLFSAMIRYFQATKADPRDPKTDNPTDAIKALDRRLISFIKQQEKEQLRPIKDELILISRKLYEMDDPASGVGKVEHLRKMNERLRLIAEKVGVSS